MSADTKLQLGEFFKAVSQLLNERLKPVSRVKASLNLAACTEIYTRIFDTVVELVTETNIPLTNEAVNYVAQCFYDGVLINGEHELDPDIFRQRATVKNMETKELALLAVMFSGTDFTKPIVEEIKHRS
jgi:hypothetical protein